MRPGPRRRSRTAGRTLLEGDLLLCGLGPRQCQHQQLAALPLAVHVVLQRPHALRLLYHAIVAAPLFLGPAGRRQSLGAGPAPGVPAQPPAPPLHPRAAPTGIPCRDEPTRPAPRALTRCASRCGAGAACCARPPPAGARQTSPPRPRRRSRRAAPAPAARRRRVSARKGGAQQLGGRAQPGGERLGHGSGRGGHEEGAGAHSAMAKPASPDSA